MPDAVISPALADRIHDGFAAGAATCDERGRPAVGRVWGVEIAADGRRVTIAVEAPEGGVMRANLQRGGTLAVICTRPTTYMSIQFKGPIRSTGPVGEIELERARAWRDRFATDVQLVGIPRRLAPLFMWEASLYLATFDVEELYDQTPGPGAGGRL